MDIERGSWPDRASQSLATVKFETNDFGDKDNIIELQSWGVDQAISRHFRQTAPKIKGPDNTSLDGRYPKDGLSGSSRKTEET